jgi:hypothetical protein
MGDPLELRLPDGTVRGTSLAGFDAGLLLNRDPKMPVLLKGLSKEDVPVGTEVWSV